MEEIRRVQYCPHCGNTAPQTLIHVQYHLEKSWSISDESEVEHSWSTFVAECNTCRHILLYDNAGDQLEPSKFHYAHMVYPKSGFLHSSVPSFITKVYEEAYRIKSVAPNAYAVQIRRALEAICNDRGASKGPLQAKLKELSDKGEMPPVLSEVSDVLRLIGNVGAHGVGESVHPLQVFALDQFFRAIVEYVYIAPSRLKEFKDRMSQFQQIKKGAK